MSVTAAQSVNRRTAIHTHFIRRTRCPACAGHDLHLLRESAYEASPLREYLDGFYRDVGQVEHEWLAGAVFTLLECRGCGTVFQRDIPDAELSERLYERWMDPAKVFERYERAHSVNFYASLARQVETIIRHFNVKPAELKVLDLGMGWGRWCMFANAYGCETYGLEVSEARIAYARANGVRVLEYNELAMHQFDVINAEQVFEHLPEPLETLAMLQKRLRPGGLLWLSVPDGSDLRRRIDRWDWTAAKDSEYSLNAVAPLEHLNGFTPQSLVTMARKAGLRPTSVATKRRATTPPPSGWKRWLGRSPAPVAADRAPSTSMFFTHAATA